jgi:hypothetical protein
MFARNTLTSDAVNRVCAEIFPRALVKSDWTTSIASNRDSPGVCAAKFVKIFKGEKTGTGDRHWKDPKKKCEVGTVQNLKVIEEGSKQHAFFFLQLKEGVFHLHPVHGELWNARKHVKPPKKEEVVPMDEDELQLSAAQKKKEKERQRVSRCRTPATCFSGSHGAFSVAGIRISSSSNSRVCPSEGSVLITEPVLKTEGPQGEIASKGTRASQIDRALERRRPLASFRRV